MEEATRQVVVSALYEVERALKDAREKRDFHQTEAVVEDEKVSSFVDAIAALKKDLEVA